MEENDIRQFASMNLTEIENEDESQMGNESNEQLQNSDDFEHGDGIHNNNLIVNYLPHDIDDSDLRVSNTFIFIYFISFVVL